ncbi:MAG: hypothetical protein IJ704_05955 [Bacilli bacterium]|nr:hypothetical protein [Bacilli bacterium]
MSYGEAKIYFDGSHYIAIPHTTRYVKRRKKKPEEVITIIENKENEGLEENSKPFVSYEEPEIEKNYVFEKELSDGELVFDTYEPIFAEEMDTKEEKGIKTTKKELFEILYQKYSYKKKDEKIDAIYQEMRPYFSTDLGCKFYIAEQFERKKRNLICRRTRMVRKANLANFNYFCTFTYDGNKHDEQSFRKKLIHTFGNLAVRKNWKYMGVWERAPKTGRLHFHGLFNIPEGTMPGEIIEVRDYSTQFHQMQTTFQSSYFNEKFGRSDFRKIDPYENKLGNALTYLMKYIEKTGEKIVYSKKLYQYFISDIFDDDIVCTIGQEDKKLLLFDNFNCWDEGVLMGKVSPEVIEQMRKCN